MRKVVFSLLILSFAIGALVSEAKSGPAKPSPSPSASSSASTSPSTSPNANDSAFGIGGAYSPNGASTYNINFLFQFSQYFKLRSTVSFYYTDQYYNNIVATNRVNNLDNYKIGGSLDFLWTCVQGSGFSVYAGPSIEYAYYNSKNYTLATGVYSSIINQHYLNLVGILGAQYAVSPKFALFFETGLFVGIYGQDQQSYNASSVMIAESLDINYSCKFRGITIGFTSFF